MPVIGASLHNNTIDASNVASVEHTRDGYWAKCYHRVNPAHTDTYVHSNSNAYSHPNAYSGSNTYFRARVDSHTHSNAAAYAHACAHD